MAKEKYISLKEAASLSGYTPDYVGQLIRRGKLPGKQVFSHVAWMTTEEALQAYIEKNKKGSTYKTPARWRDHAASITTFSTVSKLVVGATLTFVVVFILFLIYVSSVSIDRHIEQTYQQKLQHI